VPYVDLNTIHNPATGTVAPATWGDQIRDNFEFLIDPPACSISQAASQTVASSTTVVMGTTALENYDNDAMHSDSTNRSRITVSTAGRYLAIATVFTDAFLGGNNAFYRFLFRKNGSTSIGGFRMKNTPLNATEAVRIAASRTLIMAATDYIEVTFDHTLGGSIEVTLDELQMTFLTR
jgi:hypothetical protein